MPLELSSVLQKRLVAGAAGKKKNIFIYQTIIGVLGVWRHENYLDLGEQQTLKFLKLCFEIKRKLGADWK